MMKVVALISINTGCQYSSDNDIEYLVWQEEHG